MEKVEIEEYVSLHENGLPLNKIKPLNNQTYKIFSKSNSDIRIIHRSKTYKNAIAFKKIEALIKNNEYFYSIPLTTIKGTKIGFILRGVFTSDYNTVTKYSEYESKVPFMYGFDKTFFNYDKYKKCCPIIICEGCKDCMTLKKIYPFVLANNTSSMGLNSVILSNISNKFLLAYDNDDAGKDGMEKDKRILRGTGSFVDFIKIPKQYKDCTDCYIDPVSLEYNKKDFRSLSKQIKRKLKDLYEI